MRVVLLCCAATFFSTPACAAKVLIIGDLQYSFVADIASEISSTLKSPARDYSISEIRGKLGAVVERENAQVVVALGRGAIIEALRLPPEIAVVYGLIVVPPRSSRANLTGVYMSPPASEYLIAVRRYFPALGKLAVVGSPAMLKMLAGVATDHIVTYQVNNPVELVNTVGRLSGISALVLLPEAALLTSSVMDNVYTYSFRNNIPLLGVSEGNVKQGSLFALVFDTKTVSVQIGEKVRAILNGDDAGDIPQSPPRKLNLFININTAKKMGIAVPADALNHAKKIYP
ncbi:MAG: ABC transporter substrate binding protein [Desulfuromonadaceae bacterium]|nr:ABC transporter substrate binding protein [Desulfuromonadaceae bacterium]